MGRAAPERPLAVARGGDGAERTLTRPGALHPLYRRLKTELDSGAGLILILDFDGTLAPIVRRPAAARLNPSVRRTLRRLTAHPRVGLAILSGRSLPDIKRRVGLKGIVYGGSHGLEIEGPGIRFRAPLPPIAMALEEVTSRFPGAELERKGPVVAVHYRRVIPSRVRALRRSVRREAARAGLTILRGKKVWDLVPRGLAGKSTAVGRIRDHFKRAMGVRVPLTLYAGDDITDVDALRALGTRGLGVLVGSTPGPADYRLRGVREVHALLRWLEATAAGAGTGSGVRMSGG